MIIITCKICSEPMRKETYLPEHNHRITWYECNKGHKESVQEVEKRYKEQYEEYQKQGICL